MNIHPQLVPALIGAAIALPLVVLAAIALLRRWSSLKPLKRWAAFAAVAVFEAAYWLNIYAWFVEPNMLVVRRVEVASENWHGAPITIAALSDTHVTGPHVSLARMGRIVGRVNALKPDLVVLLGDYVASHEPEEERAAQERADILSGLATFAALDAPLGAVGVIGNHDSWFNRDTVTNALQEAGVAALWNRNVIVEREGGDFVVAGLADYDTGEPDYAAAIDGAPAGADVIVLAHSPDAFVEAPPGSAIMLGAHTHCGQVTVPFVGRPVLPVHTKRYACGRIDEDGKIIYVTGGIGTSMVPVRFLNPPEIVLITLRGAT